MTTKRKERSSFTVGQKIAQTVEEKQGKRRSVEEISLELPEEGVAQIQTANELWLVSLKIILQDPEGPEDPEAIQQLKQDKGSLKNISKDLVVVAQSYFYYVEFYCLEEYKSQFLY